MTGHDDWSAPTYVGGSPVRAEPQPQVPSTAAPSQPGPQPAPPAHDSAWSEPTFHGKRKHRPDLHPELLAEPDVQAAVDEPGPTVEPVQAVEPSAEPAAPSIMTSSRTMAIASLASRATGFLRTMAIAAALGTGANRIADAYNLANTLPNMVYELLLGGVLTSVIIPVLVKAQKDDDDDGIAYTQRLLSIATVGLGAATLLAVLAAPLLIAMFHASGPYGELATLWATLLLPEIFFYGLGAMFSAVLNTRHVFGWPAWAPVLNNVITLATVALFLVLPSPSQLSTTSITNTQILVLGLGTTLGIVAQALILVRPLRASGFQWQWRFRARPNEAGRMNEFRSLTLWVLGYVAVSQVGVIAINRVASGRNGGVTTFANADLLFQVPYGILGVSLLTALMPRMSRAAARGDHEGLLDDFRLGARLSSVALVPISVGLMVLAPAFTSVILLGRFDLSGARLVGVALAAGAFGLVPFALVMLQQRVFYAMRDARTPTFINVFMVGTKIVCLAVAASMFHGRAVIVALTVSTSLSYVAGALSGQYFLRRRFGRVGFTPVVRTIGWISVASLAGGVAALLMLSAVSSVLGTGRIAALLTLVLAGGAGAAVMIVVALRLPLPEVAEIKRSITGRASTSDDEAGPDEPLDSDVLPLDSEQDVIDRLRGD